MRDLMEILRIAGVIALVCVAGALATPPGRIPLALRGIMKIMRQDDSRAVAASATGASVPLARKLLAFVLVLTAILLALI